MMLNAAYCPMVPSELSIMSFLLTFTGVLGQIQPRGPLPTDRGELGVGFMFIVLVFIIFIVLLAVIGSLLILIGRAISSSDEVTAYCMLLASPASIFLIWFFWDSLRPLLARASEWAWVGVILFFLIVFIVAVCATVFSKENIGNIATVVLTVAGTLFFYLKVGWGFWSSLGGGFGASIALGCLWFMMENLIKHLRTRKQPEAERPTER